MRILFVTDYYPSYLRYLYARQPISELAYEEQYQHLLGDFFTWATYLIPYLEKGGHTARVIVGNAETLQRAWAREHGCEYSRFGLIERQIRQFRPDVLWVDCQAHYVGDLLKAAPETCLIFGWGAHEAAKRMDLRRVDCLLTSHRVFADHFRASGLQTEILLPCFEESVIDLAPPEAPSVEISFYGSLSASLFGNRIDLLNHLIQETPIEIWGEMPRFLKRPWLVGPFLRQFRLWRLWACRRRHAPVFGLEMFRLLRKSKMTFNIHVDAARGMAGNIRMFEATGMGTLLVTEAAPNLAELFEPDREVVTYASKDEAVEKIKYLLGHDEERQQIAFAGHQRTLRQHTAAKRAEEFLHLIDKHSG